MKVAPARCQETKVEGEEKVSEAIRLLSLVLSVNLEIVSYKEANSKS